MEQNLALIISIFIAKEIYDWAKDKLYKQDDEKDGQLEKNTDAIHSLNINLVTMATKLEHLTEKLTIVPKLESEVHEIKAQVREVIASLKTRTR